MSNNYWDDEDDDLDTETETQMDGSDLLKKLRKAKRADEKRIKELTEQLETFSKAQRESTVKSVLEKKGVNQKAARLVLKDLDGDFSEEAVSNWLDENADLFGIEVSQKPDAQNLAALRQQDVMTQNAVTPDRAQDLEQRMDNAGSMEELLSLMQSQQ
jgi:ABC-type sugar transport system substrate-binding protein